jgi:GNAT superfamily N-acetyltransferase
MITAAPVIRRAAETDAPKIAELLGELGYSTHPTFVRERIAFLAGRTDDCVLVAETHEDVVGVVSTHLVPLFHVDIYVGRVTALIVKSRYRRRGIGGHLLAAAERFAWEHHCAHMEVTSGGTHEPAPVFYETNGYRRVEQHLVKMRP